MKEINVTDGKIKLFNQIAVEIASMCNRSCVFCPNHGETRPDEYMAWELIEKTTQELKSMRWKGQWMPYSYNEPTRDSRLLDIIRYVSKELPSSSIIINTNCDYFKKKEDLLAVYEAGAKSVILNIYSAADGCGNPAKEERGISVAKRRGDQIEKWVEELGIDTDGAIYANNPRGTRRARVERKYGIAPDAKKINIFELQNRSGNIPWFQAPAEPLEKMCVRPWRSMNIDWLGNGILCCNDYHSYVKLGNVRDHTIEEMWNSPQMHAYRLALMRKDRHTPLCDRCDYSGGYYQHMVQPITYGSKKLDDAAIATITTRTKK